MHRQAYLYEGNPEELAEIENLRFGTEQDLRLKHWGKECQAFKFTCTECKNQYQQSDHNCTKILKNERFSQRVALTEARRLEGELKDEEKRIDDSKDIKVEYKDNLWLENFYGHIYSELSGEEKKEVLESIASCIN